MDSQLSLRARLARTNKIIYVCLGYYILMAVVTPGFFSINNSWNLLYSLIPLLVISIGQTFVMLTAGIDLSVTSIVALTSVVGGFVMSSDTSPFQAEGSRTIMGVIVMVMSGMAVGLINGFSVAKMKMPAFMVTLTSLMIFSGLAIWLTRSQNLYNLPEVFVDFPYKTLLGIPMPVYIGILVFVLALLFLNRTLHGEWIYAVGSSEKASLVSGVNVQRTLLLVYMISGICAAIGSMLYTARLETGSPVMGQNILLDVIGAVVIGGTSLFGGKGKLQWTLAGAFFMTMLDNSLNLIGLSFFLIMIVKGIIILLTAILNVVQNRRGENIA